MTVMTWNRWAALAGVAFVVLFVFGVLTIGDVPIGDESDQEVIDYYGDRGNRLMLMTCAYLVAAAGLAFMWFINHLCATLRAEEEGGPILSRAMLVGGTVFVACTFGFGAAIAAVPASIQFQDAPVPGADVSRTMAHLGFGLLLVFGGLSAAFTIAAASWAMLRNRMFPDWLGWLGFVAAVVLLFAVIFVPMIALPAWVLVVSAVLFIREREPVATA